MLGFSHSLGILKRISHRQGGTTVVTIIATTATAAATTIASTITLYPALHVFTTGRYFKPRY